MGDEINVNLAGNPTSAVYAGGNWSSPGGGFVTTQEYTNATSWSVKVPPEPEPAPVRTAKELAEMDLDSMSTDELKAQINDALVALEEGEAVWEKERTARLEADRELERARTTIKALREAGFVGIPEDSAEPKETTDPDYDPYVLNLSPNFLKNVSLKTFNTTVDPDAWKLIVGGIDSSI